MRPNSKVIALSHADIKNSKIRFTSCGRGFFPADSFGGTNASQAGKYITLIIAGLNSKIKTDLPTDKRGVPRWFPRNRSWCKIFFNQYNLKAGDKVSIKRIENYTYKVAPLSTTKNHKSHNVRVMSLFSGCGGMDLGMEGGFTVHRNCINSRIHDGWIKRNGEWAFLKKTGFETIFANDIRRSAKVSWERHFSRNGHRKGVFNLNSIVDLVKRYEAGENNVFPQDVDVVTGGFPCQDFSNAGKRNGFNSHRTHNAQLVDDSKPKTENRGQLYIWMRKVISIVRPKLFIAENVKALTTLQKAREVIEKDFERIGSGYLVVSRILRAVEYGVPQTRERIFFIAFNKEFLKAKAVVALSSTNINKEFDPFPPETHEEMIFRSLKSNKHFVCCGDVLKDLPEPGDALEDLSQKTHSGAKYYGEHCQGNTEINLNTPSFTIRAEHHGNIEFRRLSKKHGGKKLDELCSGLAERRLTVRECARIQTFPDDFDFVIKPNFRGDPQRISGSDAYVLVGNAVPPLLAYNIAINIKRKWNIWFKKG